MVGGLGGEWGWVGGRGHWVAGVGQWVYEKHTGTC